MQVNQFFVASQISKNTALAANLSAFTTNPWQFSVAHAAVHDGTATDAVYSKSWSTATKRRFRYNFAAYHRRLELQHQIGSMKRSLRIIVWLDLVAQAVKSLCTYIQRKPRRSIPTANKTHHRKNQAQSRQKKREGLSAIPRSKRLAASHEAVKRNIYLGRDPANLPPKTFFRGGRFGRQLPKPEDMPVLWKFQRKISLHDRFHRRNHFSEEAGDIFWPDSSPPARARSYPIPVDERPERHRISGRPVMHADGVHRRPLWTATRGDIPVTNDDGNETEVDEPPPRRARIGKPTASQMQEAESFLDSLLGHMPPIPRQAPDRPPSPFADLFDEDEDDDKENESHDTMAQEPANMSSTPAQSIPEPQIPAPEFEQQAQPQPSSQLPQPIHQPESLNAPSQSASEPQIPAPQSEQQAQPSVQFQPDLGSNHQQPQDSPDDAFNFDVWPMEDVEFGDIQMKQDDGLDCPMYDDEEYSEQLSSCGVNTVKETVDDSVRTPMQQQDQRPQPVQRFFLDDLYMQEKQQREEALWKSQQEARMEALQASSLEARLDRSYNFWDSITPFFETRLSPPPPPPARTTDPAPSSPISEESASLKSFQDLIGRKGIAHLRGSPFSYTHAQSIGPSATSYLMRNKLTLRTPKVLPFPRVAPPPPPPSVPPKRVVQPEPSPEPGTHAFMIQTQKRVLDQLERNFQNRMRVPVPKDPVFETSTTLGKRRAEDNTASPSPSERPTKRAWVDELPKSASIQTSDEIKPSSSRKSKKKSSSSSSSSSSTMKSRKHFQRDHNAPSPEPCPSEAPSPFLPVPVATAAPAQLEPPSTGIKRQSTLERILDYSFAKSPNGLYQLRRKEQPQSSGPRRPLLVSALRKPAAASSKRVQKRVRFALPEDEASDTATDADTDVEDDSDPSDALSACQAQASLGNATTTLRSLGHVGMKGFEHKEGVKCLRTCPTFFSSISGFFRFGMAPVAVPAQA